MASAAPGGILARWMSCLPAPLERPVRRDLHDPDWFVGSWEVLSSDGSRYRVRFVADDPHNPNRQLASRAGPGGSTVELESAVLGPRTRAPSPECFWSMR